VALLGAVLNTVPATRSEVGTVPKGYRNCSSFPLVKRRYGLILLGKTVVEPSGDRPLFLGKRGYAHPIAVHQRVDAGVRGQW
jgi:hypothetical protein